MLRLEWLLNDDCYDDERPRRIYRDRVYFDLCDRQYRQCFRLNKNQVAFILSKIEHILTHSSIRNKAITAEHQLLTTLNWLGNGAQQHGIGATHGISTSSVSRCVQRVVNAVVTHMFQNIVKWPNNIVKIPTTFLEKGGFPSVAGCIDGTLINIDAPNLNEEQYIDRHGNHSINVTMVCGPNHEFYAVDANWPGSVHDARVLRNTNVFAAFESGWRPFPGAVLLGDSAYPLKEWLIPPRHQNPNDETEQRFNRKHKSTRRLIECSYGILKERFPCLNHLRTQPYKSGMIVMTCAVFHNIACLIDHEPTEEYVYNEEDNFLNIPEEYQEEAPNVGGMNRVNSLLDYFRRRV